MFTVGGQMVLVTVSIEQRDVQISGLVIDLVQDHHFVIGQLDLVNIQESILQGLCEIRNL